MYFKSILLFQIHSRFSVEIERNPPRPHVRHQIPYKSGKLKCNLTRDQFDQQINLTTAS